MIIIMNQADLNLVRQSLEIYLRRINHETSKNEYSGDHVTDRDGVGDRVGRQSGVC